MSAITRFIMFIMGCIFGGIFAIGLYQTSVEILVMRKQHLLSECGYHAHPVSDTMWYAYFRSPNPPPFSTVLHFTNMVNSENIAGIDCYERLR